MPEIFKTFRSLNYSLPMAMVMKTLPVLHEMTELLISSLAAANEGHVRVVCSGNIALFDIHRFTEVCRGIQ